MLSHHGYSPFFRHTIGKLSLKHMNFARTYQLSIHCKQMCKICVVASNSTNIYLPIIFNLKYMKWIETSLKNVRLCKITSQKCFYAKYAAYTCLNEAQVKQKWRDEKLPHILNSNISHLTLCMINNSVFLQTHNHSKYLQNNFVSTNVFEDVSSLGRARKYISPNSSISEIASSSYREINTRLYKSRADISGNEFHPYTVRNTIDGLHCFFDTVHIDKTSIFDILLPSGKKYFPLCYFADYSQSWNRKIDIKMPTNIDFSELFFDNLNAIEVSCKQLKTPFACFKRKNELDKQEVFIRHSENISSTSIAQPLGIKQKNPEYKFLIDYLCLETNNACKYLIQKYEKAMFFVKNFNSCLSAVEGGEISMILNRNYQKMQNKFKTCNRFHNFCSEKNMCGKDSSQKPFKHNTKKNKKGIIIVLLAGCCFSKESDGKEENLMLSKTMDSFENEDLSVESETGVCSRKEINEIICERTASKPVCEIINGSSIPEINSEGIASSSKSMVKENSERAVYGIRNTNAKAENRNEDNPFQQISLPSTSYRTEMFELIRAKMKRASSVINEPSSKLMKFDINSEKNELLSQSENEVLPYEKLESYLSEKGKKLKRVQGDSRLKATADSSHVSQAEFDKDTESPNELLLTANNKCSDGGCKRRKLSEDYFELKGDEINEPCNFSNADNDESIYNISSLFSEKRLQAEYFKGKHFQGKETDEGKAKKDSKTKPNYFVAIRVDNQEIYKALENIQNHIAMQDKRLRPAMISLNTLHITLMVMHLSNSEELQRAIEALKVAYDWINAIISKSPLNLQFQGLDNFGNKVLFTKVKPGSALDFLSDIAKKVLESFGAAGISSSDPRNYNPHLTILKLSKSPALYKKGIKKITPSLYSDFKDDFFGVQTVKSIQLLSMYKPKDPTGYYFCSEEFIFDVPAKSLKVSTMVANEDKKNQVKKTISSLVQAQLKKQPKSD